MEPSRPLNVMLAVHVYGDVCGETVRSLVGELQLPQDEVRWDVVFPASDALVSRLRSELVTRAIVGGHDVLVWLDHDMAWTPGDLAGLAVRAAREEAAVGALIPFRAEWMFGRGFAWRGVPGGANAEALLGADRLVPAETVGGGFTAFSVPALARTVRALEESPDPALKVTRCRSAVEGWFWDVCRPVAVPYAEGGDALNYLSEDWALMMRLRACGERVLAWTRPLVRHVGRKSYGVGDALGIPGPVDAVEEHVRTAAEELPPRGDG